GLSRPAGEGSRLGAGRIGQQRLAGFGAHGASPLPSLADGGGEEPFTRDAVGPETETAYSARFGLFDAPFRRDARAGIPAAEGVRYPRHVFLVLLPVEGTGAVNEESAGAQRFPCVGYDAALAGCAQPYAGLAPRFACFGILAEHAFSGAGSVYGHDVEPFGKAGQMRRVVVGAEIGRASCREGGV